MTLLRTKTTLIRLTTVAVAAVLGSGCGTLSQRHAEHAPTWEAQQSLTPAAVQARLIEGNERYVRGESRRRDWAQARAETVRGQFPYAVVLSCLDSRTSAEIIFDQGHGEIFNARVAGNVLNDDILGSLEFACKAAGAKLIAVIGHTECGAIKGACTGVKLGHLTGLLERIQPAVAEALPDQPGVAEVNSRRVNAVAEANVRLVMRQIREQSPVLRELLDSGAIGLAGGLYDLQSGRVQFLGN